MAGKGYSGCVVARRCFKLVAYVRFLIGPCIPFAHLHNSTLEEKRLFGVRNVAATWRLLFTLLGSEAGTVWRFLL